MKMTNRIFAITLMVSVFAMPMFGFSSSDTNKLTAAQIQTHRSWLMKSIAGHYIAICGPGIAGECGEGYYSEDRQFHANSIAGLARIMGKTFPKGSDKGSYALPNIWGEPEKFRNELEKHQAAANRLARTASEKDHNEFDDAIRDLYRTCRSCHTVFRDERIYENYK
ncbi:cytochrome c [Porticoccaceae bacterium]|nr:cytochrome c [Porticoccaceae bacterium]